MSEQLSFVPELPSWITVETVDDKVRFRCGGRYVDGGRDRMFDDVNGRPAWQVMANTLGTCLWNDEYPHRFHEFMRAELAALKEGREIPEEYRAMRARMCELTPY